MVSYKEQKAAKRYFVLLKSGTVVGLFGNLKKLSEVGKEMDKSFLSYSTLSKNKSDRIDFDEYSIQKIGLT
jgi:hypothetical protein